MRKFGYRIIRIIIILINIFIFLALVLFATGITMGFLEIKVDYAKIIEYILHLQNEKQKP